MRARPDHRHAARHHVEQLWQFIQAGFANEATDSCDSGVAAGGLPFGGGIGLVLMHGAELEYFDQTIVVPVALLTEKHRAWRIELDRQRDQQHQG